MEQEIHALMQVQSLSFSQILSVMYASPKYENRCLLWANLKKVFKHHDLPWILMGDFNEMVDENEKLRGNPISI